MPTQQTIEKPVLRKRDRKMVGLRMNEEDYNYLQRVLEVSGMSMSGVVSDLMTGLAHMFRNVFGEDIEQIESTKQEFYLRNMVRFSLIEMSKALDEDGSPVIPTVKSKKR